MVKVQGRITVRRRPKDGSPGEPGSDAVRYWLHTSVSSVSITYSDSGERRPNPSAVVVGVRKQSGSSAPENVSFNYGENDVEGIRVTYAFSNISTTEPEKALPALPIITIPVNTEFTSVVVYLYKDGVGIDTKSISLVSDGAAGTQGLQGCIYRMTQWHDGIEYRNDSALTTAGLRFIDIVLVPNPALSAKASAYMCDTTHVSTSGNAPYSSGSNGYWTKLNSLSPIFTPFLLADGAAITLLQSNQVIVLKEDGSTVNVALGGGSYPLWIGNADPTKSNFYVDDMGKAHLTEAEVIGKIIAGISEGQRVELQPENKSMKVYDSAGSEVCSFEGNRYTSLSELFSSKSGSFVVMNRSGSDLGFGSGVSYGKGIVSVEGDDTRPVSLSRLIELSEAVHSSSPIEVSVIGSLRTEHSVGSDQGIVGHAGVGVVSTTVSPVMHKRASASIQLRIDTYSDSTLSNRIGSQTVLSCSGRAGVRDFVNAKAKTSVGGYHVLRLYLELSASGSGMTASVRWGSAISGKSDVSGSYVTDFYVSRYFANGFCLGQSANNYILAYNQGSSGMRFVMETGGYGVDVSNEGIRYRHHSGNWLGLPLFVFKGRAVYNKSSGSYSWSNTRSYNGSSPTLTRRSEGVIRFVYPSGWSGLSLSASNMIVNVVGYGSISDGDTPVKAQIKEVTSSYIDVTLSDDASRNDGGFLIDVSVV